MLRCGLWCALLAALLSGCVPIRPSGAAAADPVPGTATPPVASAEPDHAPDSAQEQFEARVLPILVEKCSPCHFQGGSMYERLPFDRPGTIRVLGTDLFTRIRDESDRQAIRDFIGAGGGAPESSPPEGPGPEDDAGVSDTRLSGPASPGRSRRSR